MSRFSLIRGSVSFFNKYKYLLIILFFFVAIRLAWLKITLASDEGELGYDAMLWLRGELPYALRFSGEPPLIYLTYMAFMALFGNTILPIRLSNDVLFFISIIGLYFLVKNWFGEKTGLLAAFFYAFLLNAPAFWGPLAVPIHLSLSFSIFSILACSEYVESKKTFFLIVSGVFLSVAGLMHWSSFAVIFVLLVILISSKRNSSAHPIRFKNSLSVNFIVLMSSILILPMFFLTYFWSVGVLDRMIQNVFVRQVTVVGPALGSWIVPYGWIFPGIMEGLPILVFGLMGLLACLLVRKRQHTYVISWLLIPLPLFLSLEPHDSYHISVIAPAASILAALGFSSFLARFTHVKLGDKLSTKRLHEAPKFIMVALLIFIFSVSVCFQALQFPNGTIRWSFVDWEYSNVGTYDQIMNLTAYLKSLNVTDGEVLVQDWLPYVYWLTGIGAPSVNLNTLQIGNLGIPSSEYERLFAKVKDKEIPYVILNANVPNGADAITDFVRANYFPLKSIGGVDVYESSYGNGVVFSFVAEFQEAQGYTILPNGTVRSLDEVNNSVVLPRIERLTIDDETQIAIRQHPLIILSNITYSNIQIPSNATLEFSIAIDPKTWNKSGDGVQFEIAIQTNGQTKGFFFKYIDPKHVADDRKWCNFAIPLAEYGNKPVSISFITTPGPFNDTNWDWADWGNPLLCTK